MPPRVALILCIGFVLWLFRQDWKRNRELSFALWVPLFWALIIGSKPASAWFGVSPEPSAEDYLEGSPFDRMIFLGLLAVGVAILIRRPINWQALLATNRWLFLFFAYLGVSTLWSDYPFVSFKRWIKDFGNVVMALVILTEADPVKAAKSVFLRCAYVLVPFSVLFIKYYPELGRYYDRWTHQPHFCGVTTNKNLLGMSIFVCAMFLCWKAIDCYGERRSGVRNKVDLLAHVGLLLMTFWLLVLAHSSTAATCTVLGIVTMVTLQVPHVRTIVSHLGAQGVALIVFLLGLNAVFDFTALFFQIVGRDATLTGRTDIWAAVLSEKINPLVGVGFYSFWSGERVERLSEKYFYHLNEAHNGYLETYLNSGLIGVALLLILLAASFKSTKVRLRNGASFDILRFAFQSSAAVYNLSEAAYNRLDLLWLALILLVIEFGPRKTGS
jgi:exopolysaccharide production protein ExoQ